MPRNRPNTKGYLKEHRDSKGKLTLIVGADDLSDLTNPYLGPRADITWDDTWVNICTDPYEGNAMLNIEAVPHLRRALAKIARQKSASVKP